MNTQTPFFIISAATDTHTLNENAYRYSMLSRQLRRAGLAVATCEGKYKGRVERSALVIDETPHNYDCFDIVIRLARTYFQEAILAVDANRNAVLRFTDCRTPENIGRFLPVSKEVATSLDAYTMRGDLYYACSS